MTMIFIASVEIFLINLIVTVNPVVSTTPVQFFSVKEELSIGYVLGVINAGLGTQFILEDTYFAVNTSNGDLSILSRLDRDSDSNLCSGAKIEAYKDDCIYTLYVVQGSGMVQVNILIIDINDNAPMWTTASTIVEIRENSALFSKHVLPMATDIDQGNNSIVRYELTPKPGEFMLRNKRFLDGRVAPELIVLQELDRESTSWYNLTLLAFDGGMFGGRTHLFIMIGDVNDNSPEFDLDKYTATVPEDAVHGFKVLNVSAKDKDIGLNAMVVYKIAPEHWLELRYAFFLESDTGFILVNDTTQIDYEKRKSFEFAVVARDMGEGAEETRVNVIIKVIDTNDNRPIIQTIGQQPLYENRPAGTFVTYVKVQDLDAGLSGQVTCSIDRTSDFKLTLMSETVSSNAANTVSMYNLTSAHGKFDRERVPSYTIIVTCQDRGDPVQFNTTRVSIVIEDENDETPTFNVIPGRNELRFTVMENQLGTVADVQATDRDKGRNSMLTYTMQWNFNENIGKNPFTISQFGQVYVAKGKELDRERYVDVFGTQIPLVFHVIATDHGIPARSASVKVIVTLADANDNAPNFINSTYTFSIAENTPIGNFIGKVSALDIDEPNHNGKVVYKILTHAPFKIIMDDGRLLVKEPLDREMNESFEFKIKAADQPINPLQQLSGIATVRVIITDVNDNEPTFIFPNSTKNVIQYVRLSYREPVDFAIAHIIAYDADCGANGKINYVILGSSAAKIFYIDLEDSFLKLRKQLSRDEIGELQLHIEARDNGKPSKSSQQLLKVIIDESTPITKMVNANPPDMELNKIIIIGIVITTGVICTVLVTAICVMARHQPCTLPCSLLTSNEELVQCSELSRNAGTEKSYSLPLETESTYDSRLASSKFDTFFQHSCNAKIIPDHVFETNSESDCDSGKGGSVHNIRPLFNAHGQYSNGYLELGSSGCCSGANHFSSSSTMLARNSAAGIQNNAVAASCAAPYPSSVGSTIGRVRPIATYSRDLTTHCNRSCGASTNSLYHSLKRNKTPSVIYEHQPPDTSSLV